jgi:glycerol-3-phosphate dehydrogenase
VDDVEKAELFNARRADSDHFPLFKLPPNITFTSNPVELEEGTLFIQAARPWELDRYYSRLKLYLQRSNGPIINIIKGFTGSRRGLILEDLAADYEIRPERLMAMAGANYPDQVMERKLSGWEVAALNPDPLKHICMLFSTNYAFTRPAINPGDVRGVQLGGALKNIYALGIGLLDGFYEKSLGGNADNSLFHISNRIFREMTDMGVALGGQETTFMGLSGLTDLMLSCFSQDARDRKYGHDFALGIADPEKKSPGIFGIKSLPGLLDLSAEKHPIAYAIHAVIVKAAPMEKVLDNIVYQLRRY